MDFNSAYRSDIEPYSGGWIDQSEAVRRRISALTRNTENMWIGIASQGESGLRGRWNAKYKNLGMNNIAAVYLTTSDSFRKRLEDDLVQFYDGYLDNERGGGGGGNGTPPYVVYVAWI